MKDNVIKNGCNTFSFLLEIATIDYYYLSLYDEIVILWFEQTEELTVYKVKLKCINNSKLLGDISM